MKASKFDFPKVSSYMYLIIPTIIYFQNKTQYNVIIIKLFWKFYFTFFSMLIFGSCVRKIIIITAMLDAKDPTNAVPETLTSINRPEMKGESMRANDITLWLIPIIPPTFLPPHRCIVKLMAATRNIVEMRLKGVKQITYSRSLNLTKVTLMLGMLPYKTQSVRHF